MSTTTTTDPTAPTVTARLCIHCDEPVPAPTSASGMTRCGHCGTLMSPDRLYDDGERIDAFELHPYFACDNCEGGGPACGEVSHRGTDASGAVWQRCDDCGPPTEDAAPTDPTDPRPTTTVTNDQGVTFHARLIRTGDRYGLVDKLTNDGAAMVEFFDAEADPAKFGPLGQFVSRYYVDTFNETAEDSRGIALEGSVPRWTITAANVAEVAAWLVSLNADDQRYEADPYTPDDGPKWTPGQPMPLTLALAIDGCSEVDVIEMALAVCQDELRRLTAPDRDPGYFLTYEDEEGDPNWLVGPFATDADRQEFAKAHPADAMPVTMYGPTNMTPDTPADFLAEMAEIAASDADWQAS